MEVNFFQLCVLKIVMPYMVMEGVTQILVSVSVILDMISITGRLIVLHVRIYEEIE